ncbi:MAG: XdhC family protein [Planctomycetota bacterium]|jgi:xanthine dehydrogenase accessory factor|nr:XdhC family protein [Planctomycetota bacterium]MDP6505688.1 XdhC family protein [Planctomycetota bacterium]
MRDLYDQIIELSQAGLKCALCTLVSTRGSTPQEAGAKLLVFPDGKTAGTIGGGCVEAEVRRRALQALDSGSPQVMDFVLDHDFGWDDGLICGGRMDVFVDVLDEHSAGIFQELRNRVEAKSPIVLGSFIKGENAGAKFLYAAEENELIGLEGGESSEDIRKAARRSRTANETSLLPVAESEDQVFLEPHLPKPTLLIAGAGHVGQALTHQGQLLDFEVVVVDDRETFANPDVLPDADKIIVDDIPSVLKEFPVDEDTYIVIVTRGHLHDQDALFSVIDRPAAYKGLIGSRRKIRMIFDEFKRLGVDEELMRNVYAPIGLDIASVTVPEIALSIAAQLVLVRRNRIVDESSAEEQVVYALRDRRNTNSSTSTVRCPQ